MAARRRCRLHRERGNGERDANRAVLWVAAALLVFLLSALVFGGWLQAAADVVFPLLEVFAGVAMLLAAGMAAWTLQRRREAAETALREACARDSFWDPEPFKVQVERLFEPYWQSVGRQNVVAVAEHLTAYWRDAMTEAFAAWRAERCKPVLFDLRFRSASIVGLEDWRDNRRDQITALVECRTSYHLTDMRGGEVVEGQPVEREEKQLWRFVRGECGWLLNRVEIVAGADAYDSCRVVSET